MKDSHQILLLHAHKYTMWSNLAWVWFYISFIYVLLDVFQKFTTPREKSLNFDDDTDCDLDEELVQWC